MKHLPLITILAIGTLAASAAVPLHWTVETSRAVPAQFEAYRGETLAFEAALQSYGKPLEAPSNYALYWQTNGMGSTYWSVPCPSSATTTNVLLATWSPTNDVGAKVYNCFIGQPGTIYHAAFQLRLRPSPGATPNELPLPQKVIDFAKVTVLNPPWSGGGGGGVDTNAVRDIVRDTLATNGIRSVDGSARPLPRYLHALDFDDSYPDAAAEYYRSRGNGKTDGGCSAVRSSGFLCRNFDYPFDDRAEFVVKMSAGNGRFASVGVAQVGTNLTEQMVTSGKPEYSRLYKWLPGATVDGINENGVACNINVVSGDPHEGGWPTNGTIHCLGAVRWVLDNATNAASAASVLATEVYFPSGWTQNFHYMVCDERETWIVENGSAHDVTDGVKVLTNFRLYPSRDTTGEGQERYDALLSGDNITSQWWTLTYTASGYRASDLHGITGDDLNQLFNYWKNNPRESHRGETFGTMTWWQTVHTSVYDLTNRVLRVAVQEVDDWYTFAVDQANVDLSPIEAQLASLQGGKRGVKDLTVYDDESVFECYSAESIYGPIPKDRCSYYWDNAEGRWHIVVKDADGRVVEDRIPHDYSTNRQANYIEIDFVTGNYFVTFSRVGYRPIPTSDTLAKESQLAQKRDKTDGDFTGTTIFFGINTVNGVEISGSNGPGRIRVGWETGETSIDINASDSMEPEVTIGKSGYATGTLSVESLHGDGASIKKDNKEVATEEYVDGSISTNNPAFVSAVRNTPTSGMPEDMPTDWGTYGTVGAALAALAAFVKWAKAKIVAVIGDDGKPTDDFASDLLGKPVANVKANTTALAPAFDATKTYAVDEVVTHDGNLYTCKTAISTAGAWDSSKWDLTPVNALIDAKIGDVNAILAAALDGSEVA